ncbi:MAG: hypothetical protein HETSPECPRED_005836 [Heterodermia speciosa]|uniref:CorA-like transporter domain-containing protein n=1 Tax=Heterodermia speciosa TaxID=116794 RepID=A0A8H3FHU3_9LECA|nr:MAG: hypothetical protein HETSPECPRED_005836 [Heterodermia speciosa]
MALAREDVLRVPPGLALEPSEIFVVDEEKCRIKIFESESDPETDPENDPSNHGATMLKQASSREEMEKLLRRVCGHEGSDKAAEYEAAELCYNVRHFELHGRQLEDPWSCRQSAIYHKYELLNGKSNWIIIQHAQGLDFARQIIDSYELSHPMDLHIRFISVLSENWRQYLDYLAGRLKDCNDGIAICKPYDQYGIDFSSKQKVHTLRSKLHYTYLIITNSLNTLEKVDAHGTAISQMLDISVSVHTTFRRQVSNLAGELQNYLQITRRLLQSSDDTRRMYDDILQARGQELIYHNGLTLANIAQAQSAETKIMVALADKTRKDSRSMRIVTFIAMIYLPANLVMVSIKSKPAETRSRAWLQLQKRVVMLTMIFLAIVVLQYEFDMV